MPIPGSAARQVESPDLARWAAEVERRDGHRAFGGGQVERPGGHRAFGGGEVERDLALACYNARSAGRRASFIAGGFHDANLQGRSLRAAACGRRQPPDVLHALDAPGRATPRRA